VKADALIEAIREGLPPGVELDERETALLDVAARFLVLGDELLDRR
jgi:hypothetical protein